MTRPSRSIPRGNPQARKAIRPPLAQSATRLMKRSKQSPLVPRDTVASNAMVLVIAIMTFLSCLTFGAVSLVRDTASTWQTQISREATIQIKPQDGLDMEKALIDARDIAARYSGVQRATIVDKEATVRLLEPWLGTGLDIDTLPVPRLVIVTIDPLARPDFAAMRTALNESVPDAILDDHRTWVDRLVAMANTTVTIGVGVLVLMLAATALTVIFATRSAMSGNMHVIEALHFAGAEARFIAREFRRHFLVAGLKGAFSGGAVAMVMFVLLSWLSSRNIGTPQGDQAAALFGNFSIGWAGYGGAVIIAGVIAFLAAATSQMVVVSYLKDMDT